MAKKRDNLIKVCLANRGEDVETPWAEDLGPAPGPTGSRRVRLANVPFLHAKPTWGDTIVVSPARGDDGLLAWDRDGVAWDELATRIAEDGGRWAMIVDYAGDAASGDATYGRLATASAKLDVVCEGAYGPERDRAGRTYLAVPRGLTPAAVMTNLRGAVVGIALTQIHPTPRPAKKKPKQAAKKTAKTRKRATGAKRGR